MRVEDGQAEWNDWSDKKVIQTSAYVRKEFKKKTKRGVKHGRMDSSFR